MSAQAPTTPQLRIARAQIYAGMIALGVPLIIFAMFGIVRHAAFSQPAATSDDDSLKLPPGLYQRQADNWSHATPQPTIAAPENYTEFAAPTATGEPYQYTDIPETNQPIPGCTATIDDAGRIIPGTEQCTGGWTMQPDTYSQPSQMQSGFSTGNSDIVNNADISQQSSGYYTMNGLKGGADQ